jgi:hypothetical protein
MSDLSMSLDGVETFAQRLSTLQGQWDGSNHILDGDQWLAGDADLTGAVDDFTAQWAKAAEVVDTYVNTLSEMAYACVAEFRKTDQDLANAQPTPIHIHGSTLIAE